MADLQGRELDAAVAERVMVQEVEWFSATALIFTNTGASVPCYSSNANAVATVRAEIERRGLNWQFYHALSDIIGLDWAHHLSEQFFKILNASPEQQSRAALAAVEGANA